MISAKRNKSPMAPWKCLMNSCTGHPVEWALFIIFYSYLHWAFSFREKNTKVQYCSSNVAIKGFINQGKWKRGYRRRKKTSRNWFRNKFLQLGSLCEIITKISACHWNLGDAFSTLKGSKSKGWVRASYVCWKMRSAGREIWGKRLDTNC